jgi:hypothetical protein
MKRALVIAVIAAAFAAAEGQAVGESPAHISSTTQFEASATLVTPPDEVGYRINIEIAGRIVAAVHSKIVQSCRAGRTVEITWTRLDGTVPQGNATQPSSRKGRFGAEATFDYGRDVPLGGGPFTITISARKVFVPGKRLGTSYRCRRLQENLIVDVPPAAG